MGSEETGKRLGGGEEVMWPQAHGCHERRVMACEWDQCGGKEVIKIL